MQLPSFWAGDLLTYLFCWGAERALAFIFQEQNLHSKTVQIAEGHIPITVPKPSKLVKGKICLRTCYTSPSNYLLSVGHCSSPPRIAFPFKDMQTLYTPHIDLTHTVTQPLNAFPKSISHLLWEPSLKKQYICDCCWGGGVHGKRFLCEERLKYSKF